MGMNFSKYVRQGKKTFSFGAMSGGAYGSSISYKYGYFNGNEFDGMSFGYQKYTEFESDPDEKDGIGSMSTVRKTSMWVGTFLDGKKNGYCTVIEDDNDREAKSGYFDMDRAVTDEEAEALSLKNKQLSLEEYTFEDWQKMPVDPVDEDGFSVLREMAFFSGGDLRFTITEGIFAGGKLNGLGAYYYDSNVNGYHTYTQMNGVFKDGEFVFGYKNSYENAGGKQPPKHFGYSDRRDIQAYGEEIVFEGKRYIGEAENGIPRGIGCLFEGEDKMIKGTFLDGKPHGFGCTYKLIDGEWVPFDYSADKKDESYYYGSCGIFVDGELKRGMTLEEFFAAYPNVKKV